MSFKNTTTAKTLRRYIGNLVEIVEKKISKALPERFGLLTDGWSRLRTHYLAIFAVWSVKGTLKVALLSMSPLVSMNKSNDDEAIRYRAVEHAGHIKRILRLYYNKSCTKNVVYLGGDHTSVNRKTAEILKKPLVGCRSHRQSLEMKRFIKKKMKLSAMLSKPARS